LRTPFIGDTKVKTETLKKLILMIQSGEKVNQHLIMYVIRFCLPTTDHYLKKLLLVFWEVVPKVGHSFSVGIISCLSVFIFRQMRRGSSCTR